MDFLKTMPFNWYLIGGCAVLVLIAIVLYYVPGGRVRIPAIAGCILFSLVGGIGAGVVTMYGLGYHWEQEPQVISWGVFDGGEPGGGEPKKGPEDGTAKKGDSKKAEPNDKNGAQKIGKGGEGKKGGDDMMAGMQAAGRSMMGNYRPMPPKDRLVSLVTKLDLLTSKTPLVNLTDDQKSKIQEKLKGLDKDQINDEEAQKTLDDILEIVEEERKALEQVGFQYPGAGGEFPRPVPNPFKYKSNADHLKSLQEHLSEKGSK